jgi:hypothetical protein
MIHAITRHFLHSLPKSTLLVLNFNSNGPDDTMDGQFIHIWSLNLKFRITRLVISSGIVSISCWIAAFSSSVVLGLRL